MNATACTKKVLTGKMSLCSGKFRKTYCRNNEGVEHLSAGEAGTLSTLITCNEDRLN